MLDKHLLQNWKAFQKRRFKRKLEMANSYPCNFIFKDVRFTRGTLSIITEGEQRLEIREGFMTLTITLNNLGGYNLEGRNIILTLLPEQPPVILEFQTSEILEVAFSNLQDFAREIVHIPIPPSSESNESENGSSTESSE